MRFQKSLLMLSSVLSTTRAFHSILYTNNVCYGQKNDVSLYFMCVLHCIHRVSTSLLYVHVCGGGVSNSHVHACFVFGLCGAVRARRSIMKLNQSLDEESFDVLMRVRAHTHTHCTVMMDMCFLFVNNF